MNAAPETARILRVFVSSPGDVAAKRAVLDEVVESINRTAERAGAGWNSGNGNKTRCRRWVRSRKP